MECTFMLKEEKLDSGWVLHLMKITTMQAKASDTSQAILSTQR